MAKTAWLLESQCSANGKQVKNTLPSAQELKAKKNYASLTQLLVMQAPRAS
jgi:hypothetical protein